MEWEYPRLTFFSWVIIYRFAWLCGFYKNGEPINEARFRAKLGAEKLEQFAKDKTTVINTGHGIMNRLVIKELKHKGWQIKEHTGAKYWSYTVLKKEK